MTWFRCGGSGIPAALKSQMNDVLNKKFGTSIDYPPNGWPDDVNLLGPLPVKTASGVIASFSDGADDVPISSGLFSFTPKQAGTGTPSPSNPRAISGYTGMTINHAGKNIANIRADNVDNGQRYTISKLNDTVTVTATGTYARAGWIIPTKIGQTYTLSFSAYGDGNYNRVNLFNSVTWSSAFWNVTLTETETQYTSTFTATTETTFFGIYVTSTGTTGSITVSDVQIELGSQATTFEKYKAKTPIVDDFGRTIYGGSRSTDGTLTDGYGIVTFDGSESWKKHGSIPSWFYLDAVLPLAYGDNNKDDFQVCNMGAQIKYANIASATNGQFGYSSAIRRFVFVNTDYTEVTDFQTWLSNNNLVVAYKLTTPIEYQVDTISIPSYLGSNNIFTDQETGLCSIDYRADIDLALQAVSGSRGLMMASRPVTQMVGEESDLDRVNELVEDNETEQEDENDAR